MDKHRENMIAHGLSQVYTGLGILLGAGKISVENHGRILSLLNSGGRLAGSAEDEWLDPKAQMSIATTLGKDTPVSVPSNDISNRVADLTLIDYVQQSPTKIEHRMQEGRGNASSMKRPSSSRDWRQARRLSEPGGELKIICPYWSTPGYTCREENQGRCEFYHEDMADGVRDPLICKFWADGQRCTKSQDECKFAHFPAQHKRIAPLPTLKKKAKKYHATWDDAEPEGW